MLMMLTRMFDASPNVSVFGLCHSESVVTHSSVLVKYAVQSDPAAVQSQILRQSASEKELPRRLLYMNSVLCLRPTPARTGFGGGGLGGRSSCPGTRTDSKEPGETSFISIWKVCDKSTFRPWLCIQCNTVLFGPPRRPYGAGRFP